MTLHRRRPVGIPWFRSDSYRRTLILMADTALPLTFEEWEREARRQERTAVENRRRPYRIPFDPDKFASWCRRNGRTPDAGARAAYADEEARHMAEEGWDGGHRTAAAQPIP